MHLSLICVSILSNNYGPFHFPEDHAKALYQILQHGKTGETYIVGGEAEWRNIDLIHEIINIIAEITKSNKEELKQLITYVKDRPGHDLRYAIDCSKIKNEMGWKPSHTFPEGLRKTIQWYVDNLDWVRNIQSGSYRQWLELNYSER